jgi:hypothetical protein
VALLVKVYGQLAAPVVVEIVTALQRIVVPCLNMTDPVGSTVEPVFVGGATVAVIVVC